MAAKAPPFQDFFGEAALLFHGPGKAGFIDGKTLFKGNIPHDIHWKAIGVIELENEVPGDGAAPPVLQPAYFAVEHGKAVVKGFAKLCFFVADHLGKKVCRL